VTLSRKHHYWLIITELPLDASFLRRSTSSQCCCASFEVISTSLCPSIWPSIEFDWPSPSGSRRRCRWWWWRLKGKGIHLRTVTVSIGLGSGLGSAWQLAAAEQGTDDDVSLTLASLLLAVRRRSCRVRRLSALALPISRELEPAVWKIWGPVRTEIQGHPRSYQNSRIDGSLTLKPIFWYAWKKTGNLAGKIRHTSK